MLEQEFNNIVSKYDSLIDPNNEESYEYSFFKIYVNFEIFITDLFVNYATGINSEKGYCPRRLLCFPDRDKMDNFLKIGGKRYVDYFEIAKSYSNVFFDDNPFNVLKENSDFPILLKKMQSIRNYIAHGSNESKLSYIRYVLCDNSFIEPGNYLKLRALNITPSITNYSYFVSKMREMVSLVQESSLL